MALSFTMDPVAEQEPQQPVDSGLGFTMSPQEPQATSQPVDTGLGFTMSDTQSSYPELSSAEKYQYLLGQGFTDSIRGGAQIIGLKEEEMKAQQVKTDALLSELGASGYAAWIAGLVLDPVALAMPMSRIKHAWTGIKAIKNAGFGGKMLSEAGIQATAGGAVGALSYVDENQESLLGDGPMTRTEQALIGVGAGAIAGPVLGAGARKWGQSGAGEKLWKAASNPEVATGITGGGLGGFAGYHSGINEEGEPLLGSMFSDEFVNSGGYAKWRNALVGATVGAATGRKLGKEKPHWFKPDFGIEDTMLHEKAKVKPRVAKILEENVEPVIAKMNKTFDAIPKAHRAKAKEMVYRMITDGPKAAKAIIKGIDEDLVEEAPDIARAMTEMRSDVLSVVQKMGRELAREGLLDEKIWLKNKDSYLHRIFKKDGGAQQQVATGGHDIIEDMFLARGRQQNVTQAEFDEILAKNEPDHHWEKWDVNKDTLTKKEMGEGKFTIRRDHTPQERIDMGENTDILDAFRATGQMMANNISAVRYLKAIAAMPNVSSANKIEGKAINMPVTESALRNSRAGKAQIPPQVEQGAANHTHQLRGSQYGKDLDGRWVTAETKMDLESMAGGGTLNKVLNAKVVKSYQKANSLWKATKTIMNPAVHFNNAMSNVIMYDLGVTAMGPRKWKVLAVASKEAAEAGMAKGKKSADFLEAEARGVFGVNLNQELAEGSLDGVAKSLSKSLGAKSVKAQNQAVNMMGHTTRMLSWVKGKTYDKMAAAYAYEDNIFRLAMFKAEKEKLMDLGVIESMANDRAAAKAREWFVDYSRQTPALSVLKNLPLPFFSYTYGIVPRLAESAIKHPVKIAKWASIGYLLNEAGAYGSEKSLEDIKETERLDAEVQGKYSMMGMRNRIRIPDKLNPFGTDGYADLGRMIPGGQPFGAKSGGAGQITVLPDSAQPSFGALGGVLYPAMGIDPYTGKAIPEGGKLEAMARQFTPNIAGIPGSFAQKKIDLANGLDDGGRTKYKDEHTPGSAWAAAFGPKIVPVSDRKNKQRIKFRYQEKIDSVEKEIRNLKTKRKERTINDEAFRKRMDALRNKKQRIKKNLRKAVNG